MPLLVRDCVGLLLFGASLLITRAASAEEPKPVKPGEGITNSIGMKLALIPAGEFLMGSPDTEKDRGTNEKQHKVKITKAFYLGVYAVTQEEYEKIIGKNPSWFSSQGDGKDKVAGMDTKRFPVERVSWDDAVEFCKKLSQKEAKTYRLPTEAEWEYACRAGTKSPYSFGDTLNGDSANCNGTYPYGTATNGTYLARTTKIGSYKPNAFGLYDMHGNVRQWCSDWYDKDYYANTPAVDPSGPSSGSNRVFRGGDWSAKGKLCRSAYRNGLAPDQGYTFQGLRVALVPASQDK